MIPTSFFGADAIPLNNSGKTDRKKLQAIGAGFTMQELAQMGGGALKPKAAPTTETERTMQSLWARVLEVNLAMIGAEDNFFRLGATPSLQ